MSLCCLFWSLVASFLQKPDARLFTHIYSWGSLQLLGVAGCRVDQSQHECQRVWACAEPLSFSFSPPLPSPTSSWCLLLSLMSLRTECLRGSAGWITPCCSLSEVPHMWPLLVTFTSHQSSVCFWHFWNLKNLFFYHLFVCEFITRTPLPTVVLMEFRI